MENKAILETERLILRPWNIDDTPFLFKYASDPDVGPGAGWPPHNSLEESRQLIETIFNNDTTWAMVLKDVGEPVGCIGYLRHNNANIPIGEEEAEVGYWVGRPFWNNGLCSEALSCLVEYCFNTLGIKCLWGDCFTDNPSSARVMTKCGFTNCHIERKCESLIVGKDKPVMLFKLENKNNIIMNELIACCGLNCEKCDARMATINNDEELRKKTAKFWGELNNCEISPDQINCLGCRSKGVKNVYWHLCEIRNCVMEKGFDTCGDCPQMENCSILSKLTEHNKDALSNLKCCCSK